MDALHYCEEWQLDFQLAVLGNDQMPNFPQTNWKDYTIRLATDSIKGILHNRYRIENWIDGLTIPLIVQDTTALKAAIIIFDKFNYNIKDAYARLSDSLSSKITEILFSQIYRPDGTLERSIMADTVVFPPDSATLTSPKSLGWDYTGYGYTEGTTRDN